MSVLAEARARPAASPAPLVVLLALAIFVNYVDRGNLGTAGPLIKDELKLSNFQFGLLTSAFYWIYAPAQPFAAWMINRLNAYRALALGLAVWSLATALTGLVPSLPFLGFWLLLLLRLMLGLGESAGFPASSKLIAAHLPHHRLGVANALIGCGLMLGPAAGTFLGGLMLAHSGWRVLFLGFGALSLLWLVPWTLATRSHSTQARLAGREAEPSYRELLSKRELWGASLGHFGFNYAFYLVLSWLPLYLVKAQGFSLVEMARLGGIVYGLSAGIGLIAGWASDRWLASGASSNRVLKSVLAVAATMSLGCMLACAFGDRQVAVGALIASSIANGLGAFSMYAAGQTLAGPRATGKWMGVQNGTGNLAGIIAPTATGLIVDMTGSFSLAFLAAAVVVAFGLIGWIVVVRKVTPLAWTDPQPGGKAV